LYCVLIICTISLLVIEKCFAKSKITFNSSLTTSPSDAATNNNFLIIGSESHGISDYLMKFIDEKVKIENVSAGGESLNAAIATGIILYQLS